MSEKDKSNDNFYSLVENTKGVLKDDDSWWVQDGEGEPPAAFRSVEEGGVGLP